MTTTSSATSRGTAPSSRRLLVWIVVGLVVVAAATLLIWATSSSSPSATAVTCPKVAAVLADGPDPDADPVGYAEAQIKPLLQVTTSDAALRQAIVKLSHAYQAFYVAGGSSASAKVVAAATRSINTFCPGVAS